MSRLFSVVPAIAVVAAAAAAFAARALRKARRSGPSNVAANDSAALQASTVQQSAPAKASTAQQSGPAKATSVQALAAAQISAKLHELALGASGPEPLSTEQDDAILAATLATLHDAATQQRYAPRRPHMLPRLMSAASDENVSRRELASIIARDPSLVGGLLKIANSSFYRVTAEPVESVDRAVVLLGTDGLRSLISAALLQPIFRIAGGHFPRFPEIAWEHAFRSASAAVPYAVIVEKSDPFAAELLSLVMGLAGIVVFRVALDQYAADLRLQPEARVMASLLDTQSANVAQRIGASWELSERMLVALQDQITTASIRPTPLGRSLHFGRVVGALALLRINRVIDEETAVASIPQSEMPAAQQARMWARLTLTEPSGR